MKKIKIIIICGLLLASAIVINRFLSVNTSIVFTMSTEMTVEQANQWLENNNVDFWYPLATPTYTKITGTLAEQLENVYQGLKSYAGQTNISQINNDLPFLLGAVAIAK